MRVTTGKAQLNEGQLKNLPASEIAKIAARAEGKPDPEPTQEEKAVSAAQARLKRRREMPFDELVPVEVDGEKLAIRRLNYTGLGEVALSVQRDGLNVLNIGDNDGVRSVTRAVLLLCVATEDGEPFFTYQDVNEFMDKPSEVTFISQLFVLCNEVNPDLNRTLKKT